MVGEAWNWLSDEAKCSEKMYLTDDPVDVSDGYRERKRKEFAD